MTEEILKLLLEIRRVIETGPIAVKIDAILARGPKTNFPWYAIHQWGQDLDYQWYQSCGCRRCAARTEEIAAQQALMKRP